METVDRIILKDKEITDPKLISLVRACLIETGGIRHVSMNLSALGYHEFNETAYLKLDESKQTKILNFSELSSNHFLVICIVVFVTVKDVEDDTLISTPFNEGIELIRKI